MTTKKWLITLVTPRDAFEVVLDESGLALTIADRIVRWDPATAFRIRNAADRTNCRILLAFLAQSAATEPVMYDLIDWRCKQYSTAHANIISLTVQLTFHMIAQSFRLDRCRWHVRWLVTCLGNDYQLHIQFSHSILGCMESVCLQRTTPTPTSKPILPFEWNQLTSNNSFLGMEI